MRKIILFIMSLFVAVNGFAADDAKKVQKQLKADLVAARAAIKNNKDLEKNEANLRKYLSDENFKEDMDVRSTLFDVIKKEYDGFNESVYLKQKVDTAKFMKTVCRLFEMAEHIDSLDTRPNAKGVPVLAYRKKHSAVLFPYINNVLTGGQYFFTHKQWQDALHTLSLYLDLKNQPLFSGHKIDDSHDVRAAYMIAISAVQIKDKDNALKYADEALKYNSQREATMQLLAELCKEKGDTLHYVAYLKDGFLDYPKSEYFFPHLIDYHSARGDYKQACEYARQAVRLDSTNVLYLMAHHSMLMLLDKKEEAMTSGLRLLERCDTLPMPNYNVGYLYYLQAQEASKEKGKPLKVRMKEAQKYYKLCMPYMEAYRRMRPDDKQRWRPVLYDVYLNLNMGKEFQEIENVQ